MSTLVTVRFASRTAAGGVTSALATIHDRELRDGAILLGAHSRQVRARLARDVLGAAGAEKVH